MHCKSLGLRVPPRPTARLLPWVSSLFLTAAALCPLQAQTIVHQINLASNESWCSDSAITTLFQQINAVRASKGIPALAMDGVGMKVSELRAVQFATYMF